MRFKYILLALAGFMQIAVANAFALNGFKNGEQLNVWAAKGLPLKQKPGVKGENIMIIPYGQSVMVVGDAKPSSPASITINNYALSYKLKGKWIKVSYKGKQGYVFDGYLSKMPPFIKAKYDLFESEEDYLKRNYGVARVKNVKGKNGYEKNTIYYKNGDVSTLTIFDGCFDTELYLKNITYQEGVLFKQATYNDADAPIEDFKIKVLKERIKISYYYCD